VNHQEQPAPGILGLQICDSHCDKIREALVAAGLGPFWADTAEEVLRRNESLARGDELSKDNFDPMILAAIMIASSAAQASSIVPMRSAFGVLACPICAFVAEHNRICPCDQFESKFIEGLGWCTYEQAARIGLVPTLPTGDEPS
jgi:hypothetical protein